MSTFRLPKKPRRVFGPQAENKFLIIFGAALPPQKFFSRRECALPAPGGQDALTQRNPFVKEVPKGLL